MDIRHCLYSDIDCLVSPPTKPGPSVEVDFVDYHSCTDYHLSRPLVVPIFQL